MSHHKSDPNDWKNLSEADMALVVMVLEALGDHADMSIIDEAAIEAGILWKCSCDWFNPANQKECGNCPHTRDQSIE